MFPATIAMADFNFMECVGMWDNEVALRRRAQSMQVLAKDLKDKKNVLPTLKNIKFNAALLNPITKVMANRGYIYQWVDLLHEPLTRFYLENLHEDDKRKPDTNGRITSKVSQTAFFVKRMLSVVKRKWAKWEMPRAPCMKFVVF